MQTYDGPERSPLAVNMPNKQSNRFIIKFYYVYFILINTWLEIQLMTSAEVSLKNSHLMKTISS